MDASSRPASLLWRICLFDGPLLIDAAGNITRRFRSQRIGALLAYLALNLGRPCAREELYEALWPEEPIEVTANRLRVSLSSLRKQVEPPGVPFGAVIDVSEHSRIRLRPEAAACDVHDFDALWDAGRHIEAARIAKNRALLPGYYDEWVLDARNRIELLVEDIELPAQPASKQADSAPLPQSQRRPATQHQLPLYLTKFFGRDSEKLSLVEMLASCRLVTLAGPGGIGKTRLAVEAAANYTGTVLFVPLADVTDPDQLPVAILKAMHISAQAETDPSDQLTSVLKHHRVDLIVLDNTEQVTSPVADLCIKLLQLDPNLTLLVTSRHHLEIPGEVILPVTPLESPPHTAAVEVLTEWPSIALFLDRARAIRPDFSFSPRMALPVVEICRKLDGIPLALELAAARTAGESLTQIAESLNTSLIDISSRHRNLSERHRSLRAAIQGSYDLLQPELQTFFAALSVFHGGWTADAAESVTGSAGATEYLTDLITRSLIVPRPPEVGSGVMRFAFLEPLRQFASEVLDRDETAAYKDMHANYFLSLAASVTEDDIRPYVLLDGEQENLLAALERRSSTRDQQFWTGLFGFVFHAWSRADHRITLRWIDEAVALIPTIIDPLVRLGILSMITHVWTDVGRYEDALRVVGELKSHAVATGDDLLPVSAEITRSYILIHTSQFREARDIAIAALDSARALAMRRTLLWGLSMAACALSDYGFHLGASTTEGRACLIEAEAVCRELIATMTEYSRFRSTCHHMLAVIQDSLGRHSEGYENAKLAQRIALDHKKLSVFMYGLLHEAVLAERVDMPEYAATLLGAAFVLQERMAFNFGAQAEAVQSLRARLEARLGSSEYESRLAQGRMTSHEELMEMRLPQQRVARSEEPGSRNEKQAIRSEG